MADAGRLVELYMQACSLSGSEREALVGRAREEDAELGARLEELLARSAEVPTETGSFGRRLTEHYGAEADPHISLEGGPESSDFASEVVERLSGRGQSFGRYKLEGEMARGGQGAILRVWDEDLRRKLAMKVVLSREESRQAGTGLVDSRTLGRFLEEAQVTGQLDHPGIVPVHELGLDDAGQVYFTMKLVKGRDLRAIFDLVHAQEEGWTQTRAISVLLKVCEAMAYAHDKGVIHRDLKPANVMVGRYGEAYVMDWGLAKIRGREDRKDIRIRMEAATDPTIIESDRREHASKGADSPLFTMDGDVVGTPAYMPPEQAAGHPEKMGPHSDVYAVGAMLYHLIAGHTPFVPPGARMSNYVILRWVNEGPPLALEQLAPEAPAELVAICEKAMAREIEHRYPDMAALSADLSAYLEGRVVRAYETGAWAEGRKWVRRNRPLAAALAGALIVALGGLGTTGYVQAKGRTVAENERKRADSKAEEVLSLSALQDLEDLVAEADELWPIRPEIAPRCEEWIERASALMKEAPGHTSKLAELDRESDSRETRWWVAQLTKLVDGLDELESGLLAKDVATEAHGWSVARRLAHARLLEESFGPDGELTRRWENDLEDIRADLPDLMLVPQLGLVPIGRDPDSGLWEFWHVASGTEPQRDEDDVLRMEEESGLVLVLIPGGTFDMGAVVQAPPSNPGLLNVDPWALSNEAPVHAVTLAPYFLSKFELTQGQWQNLAGFNPSGFGPGQEHEGVVHSLLHPVESVSWNMCRELLDRVGLDLPTEAQWEFAARAWTTAPWSTGGNHASLVGSVNLVDQTAMRAGMKWPHIAVFPSLDDGFVYHAPVGTFAPNPFGLHDMHGNVWEWARDLYCDYTAPLLPGTGERVETTSSQRMVRGGSYRFDPGAARSARRFDVSPGARDNTTGVRPARAIQP